MPRFGYVSIVGVANVGKSTLLNRFVGQELAVVTPRPQTTRDRLVGVCTLPAGQIAFVDTPGLYGGRDRMGRYMEGEARRAIGGGDVVLMVSDARTSPGTVPLAEESRIVDSVRRQGRPVVLALNKIDRVVPKSRLLPLIERWGSAGVFVHIVPISATNGDGFDTLLGCLLPLLPEGPPGFSEDALTDRNERFLVAEAIRAAIYLGTQHEVPYAAAVTVDSFEDRSERGDSVVTATIHVERPGQQGILIGKGGAMIREIGTRARQRASRLLGRPIHLRLRVQVTPNWSQDGAALERLGYGGDGS